MYLCGKSQTFYKATLEAVSRDINLLNIEVLEGKRLPFTVKIETDNLGGYKVTYTELSAKEVK